MEKFVESRSGTFLYHVFLRALFRFQAPSQPYIRIRKFINGSFESKFIHFTTYLTRSEHRFVHTCSRYEECIRRRTLVVRLCAFSKYNYSSGLYVINGFINSQNDHVTPPRVRYFSCASAYLNRGVIWLKVGLSSRDRFADSLSLFSLPSSPRKRYRCAPYAAELRRILKR